MPKDSKGRVYHGWMNLKGARPSFWYFCLLPASNDPHINCDRIYRSREGAASCNTAWMKDQGIKPVKVRIEIVED